MKIKEIEINYNEYNLNLEDILYRELCKECGQINYEDFINNLEIPEEIGIRVGEILHRFKIILK